MLNRLKYLMIPSYLNGSLTPWDALLLVTKLVRNLPIDKKSDVWSYERAVAKTLDLPHVFALGAGRMALYLLLKSLKLEAGVEVILPGYTCVVMPNAVRFAGCQPRYIDIRLSDFNLDPGALEAAITSNTRVVLMQHTFGIPADIVTIKNICRRYNLFLIEDGAHALGAMYRGMPIGCWGDAALFSTETSKMISTDKGGLLVTTDSALAAKIRSLYDSLPIRSSELERIACKRVILNILTQDPFLNLIERLINKLFGLSITNLPRFKAYSASHTSEYEAELTGVRFDCYPRRLAGILCGVGELQIHRLMDDVRMRNEKAAFLTEILPRYGARVPSYDREQCYPSFVKYPFLVEDREKWIDALNELRLPTWTWLNDPLHPRETRCHAENQYVWGSCPNAEYASQHILNLPIGRSVTFSMLARLKHLHL